MITINGSQTIKLLITYFVLVPFLIYVGSKDSQGAEERNFNVDKVKAPDLFILDGNPNENFWSDVNKIDNFHQTSQMMVRRPQKEQKY